ncbi:MAG: hypothetical protein AB8B46_00150 [Candidatus Midichloriaceae bacterium]
MHDILELGTATGFNQIDQCLINEEPLSQALSNLFIEKESFAFYDLGLSDEEKFFLSTVKITKKDADLIFEYDQENVFFDLKDLQLQSKKSLEKLVKCENETEEYCADYLSKLIDRLANNIAKISGYTDARVLIRVGNTIATDWHTDGSYIEGLKSERMANIIEKFHLSRISDEIIKIESTNQLSFAFNLIGDSTMFYNATIEEKPSLFSDKEIIKGKLNNEKIHNATSGFGSVFFNGYKDGTIHSAPESDKDILFVLVQTGASDLLRLVKQTTDISFLKEEMHTSNNKEQSRMRGEISKLREQLISANKEIVKLLNLLHKTPGAC